MTEILSKNLLGGLLWIITVTTISWTRMLFKKISETKVENILNLKVSSNNYSIQKHTKCHLFQGQFSLSFFASFRINWKRLSSTQIQYLRYYFSVRVCFHWTLNTSNKVYIIETCNYSRSSLERETYIIQRSITHRLKNA